MSERRAVLPSIAATRPWAASQTRFVHSMKSIAGRHSVGEFEEGIEPVDFGAAEGFDIAPAVGAGDDGAYGDRDDVSFWLALAFGAPHAL